ncbi:MAG: hypothetical protein R3325_06360 [Thermoanaerobaculia bacterium]|nr:hypothetical protein [Thermoanaerobaculia bacterium]
MRRTRLATTAALLAALAACKPGPPGPPGPEGPAGPPGGGAVVLYQRSVDFTCNGGGGNCNVPPLVAQCDPGDVATGGAAYRTPHQPGFPLQDRASFPDPKGGAAPPTGWSTSQGTIPDGDRLDVIAICADLTP